MKPDKINRVLMGTATFFVLINLGFGEISENELEEHRSFFKKKIISDNPLYEKKIREILNGVIKKDNTGIRLIDKFALFTFDIKKNGINIKKIKFYYRKNIFHFFMVFADKEKSEYTLFLEYEFNKAENRCNLIDVYFSLVFGEKKEEIEKFFRYR